MVQIDGVPMEVPSLANKRMHHMQRAKIVKAMRNAVGWLLIGHELAHGRFPLPCVVTLVRVSSGVLDAHDNLPASLKPCVDAIAKWIACDDADPRVQWRYAQEKAPRGTQGLRIVFRTPAEQREHDRCTTWGEVMT